MTCFCLTRERPGGLDGRLVPAVPRPGFAYAARLAQLPDVQQEVITLAFYGQLTHAEIADRLDLPHGTVKGRMRLGLEKLRSADESARTDFTAGAGVCDPLPSDEVAARVARLPPLARATRGPTRPRHR